jgi:hypothetical protein
MNMRKTICTITMMLAAGAMVGCDGRPALIPNKDASLRRTSTSFAADAAKRTYEAEAPREAEKQGRVEVNYTIKEIELANLSSEDWVDVEVWINQKYVVSIPMISKANKGAGYRHLNFQMFYDNQGNHIPAGMFNGSFRVEKVEVYRDGKMYEMTKRLAD